MNEPERPGAAAPRSRDSILQALLLCRQLHPNFGLNDLISFLYLCENDLITIAELAELCPFTTATTSRSIRSLAEPEAPGALPPRLGLVRLVPNPEDLRGRLLTLTPAGQELRERLDGVIARACPIRLHCSS
jgi:DNA-binding MarR family transcriptional regulator